MRFLSVIITALAIIGSCIFAFLTINEKEQQISLNASISKSENVLQNYIDSSDKNDKLLEQKLSEKQLTETEYNRLKNIITYKKNPCAFFTFDDVPNSYTSDILNTLSENNIHATFFLNSAYLKNDTAVSLVRSMVNSGHSLGIYCYNTSMSKTFSSEEQFFNTLYDSCKTIKDICGYDIKLVRLAGGTASAKTLCKKYSGSDDLFKSIIDRLKKEGYIITDWNVDSEDWDNNIDTEQSTQNIISGCNKRLTSTYKAALIMLHNKKNTSEILQLSINELLKKGYTFEAMSQDGYTYVQTIN